MTIHKAQGITVSKAVFNITEKEFALGLTYVTLSRVKSLDGILFEEPFDYERFLRKKPHPSMVMRHEDAQSRRPQHVFSPFPTSSWNIANTGFFLV